jgi:hypothetical protein
MNIPAKKKPTARHSHCEEKRSSGAGNALSLPNQSAACYFFSVLHIGVMLELPQGRFKIGRFNLKNIQARQFLINFVWKRLYD